MPERKIRVLVADGSVTEREKIVALLRADPLVEVVGEVAHGVAAVESARRTRPDVIALSIQIPDQGGCKVANEIMIEVPTPIVIVSNESDDREVKTSLLALKAGALAVVSTPSKFRGDLPAAARHFVATIKSMAGVKVVRRWRDRKPAATSVTPPAPAGRMPIRIVAIGASTGGPAALLEVLSALPVEFSAPILVVQHIGDGFVGGLVGWLNEQCALEVKLAIDGEPLMPRTVYVAPEGRHLGVEKEFRIALSTADPIGGFRPSASYLFESVARAFGAASLHVILTGMGQDGVSGLKAAYAAGARVLAQDEASSVVFGMPAAAIGAGIVHSILPLHSVSNELVAATGRNRIQ